MGRAPLIDWSAVDWSLSNSELGRMYDVRPNTFAVQRHRLRKAQGMASSRYQPILDADAAGGIDWAMTDSAIARSLGVSRVSVGRYRRRHAHVDT